MKKILLAGVALAAMSTLATAADLPRKTAPIQPIVYAPAFSWTGFYVGGNAGYAFGSTTTRNSFNGLVPAGAQLFGDSDGFVGGGQVGYNYQFYNNFVIGAEADFQGSLVESTRAPVFGTTSKASLDYFGTVRARVGYAFAGTNSVLDRTLIYVTGGLAYGSQSYNIAGYSSPSSTQVGYAAGAGVEYAFTNNWTAKLEGLYVDLGRENYVFTNANPVIPAIRTRASNDFAVVRAGLNYKF